MPPPDPAPDALAPLMLRPEPAPGDAGGAPVRRPTAFAAGAAWALGGRPYAGGRVVSLTRDDDFAALAPAWDALADLAPQRLPMLGSVWVRAFARHRLGPGESMVVHAALSGGRVVGVLPLVARPSRLGTTLAAPRGDHTRAGDAVLSPDLPATDLRGLVEAAFASRPDAGALTLAGVRDSSPTLAAVAALEGPFLVVADDDERGSFVTLRGRTMADVRAALHDNFRRNLRKADNRLAREAGVSFHFDEGASADPAALDTFLALEAAGWKGRAGTAIAHDARLLAFYRELVAGFAARRRLEWIWLEIGGRTAAMFLGVRLPRALVLLKIAYDEAFARLGPGNLLFERLLEREIVAGHLDEINCTTDMPWHRLWALSSARYARFHVVPRRLSPIATRYLPWALRARARRIGWVRRLLHKPPLGPPPGPPGSHG